MGGNELLDAVSGFDEAIRSYMIGVLSITFQKVEVRRRHEAMVKARVTPPRLTELRNTPLAPAPQSETFADLLALDEGDLEEYVSANQSDKLSIEGKNVR